MRLASHLHIPVGELQQRVTSSEFVEWMEYLEQEVHDFHREDFYLAQIAMEVRRASLTSGAVVRLSDFLLTFKSRSAMTDDPKLREQTSEAFWFGLVGVDRNQE